MVAECYQWLRVCDVWNEKPSAVYRLGMEGHKEWPLPRLQYCVHYSPSPQLPLSVVAALAGWPGHHAVCVCMCVCVCVCARVCECVGNPRVVADGTTDAARNKRQQIKRREHKRGNRHNPPTPSVFRRVLLCLATASKRPCGVPHRDMAEQGLRPEKRTTAFPEFFFSHFGPIWRYFPRSFSSCVILEIAPGNMGCLRCESGGHEVLRSRSGAVGTELVAGLALVCRLSVGGAVTELAPALKSSSSSLYVSLPACLPLTRFHLGSRVFNLDNVSNVSPHLSARPHLVGMTATETCARYFLLPLLCNTKCPDFSPEQPAISYYFRNPDQAIVSHARHATDISSADARRPDGISLLGAKRLCQMARPGGGFGRTLSRPTVLPRACLVLPTRLELNPGSTPSSLSPSSLSGRLVGFQAWSRVMT
ncbi:hypothetical protein B0H67DRAFT_50094 [Lasiosphaeris hirsuta]|uniref:Uncharacterized protein n=1 Tax=Lasiosphaeris hirsuta TaxID=260670 RepID=A0AA40E767_9PEZI|nr:hypothetical protein B0H67DRAFT_50094 [Lasiosphaeris hirsuta]